MTANGWNHDRNILRGRLAILALVCAAGMLALSGCSGSSSDTRTQAKASQSGTYEVFAQIATPRNGDFILFHADGTTDATFEAVASGGTDPLNYNWSITGPDYRNTATGETGTITFYTPGQYTFTLTVVDARGLTDTDTIHITAGYAQDQQLIGSGLQAVILNPSTDTTIRVGDSISYTSNVIGGSGTYGYLWNFPGGSTQTATIASPAAVTYNQPGTYTTTLTVTDSFGNSVTDTVRVTVGAASSTPLSVVITAPIPLNRIVPLLTGGTTVTFTATVSGATTPQYFWTITGPGLTGVTGTAASITQTFTQAGPYTVRVQVTDQANGAQTVDTMTIQLQ